MAVKNEEKSSDGKIVYIYKRCLPCGIKLHVGTRKCLKCGRKATDTTYGSDNPEDAIYNRSLNQVNKCFSCFNTLQGNPCLYVICFGTGKGDCEICKRFKSIRFECCQKVQARENKGAINV